MADLANAAKDALKGLRWSIAALDWSRGVKFYLRSVTDLTRLKHKFPVEVWVIRGFFAIQARLSLGDQVVVSRLLFVHLPCVFHGHFWWRIIISSFFLRASRNSVSSAFYVLAKINCRFLLPFYFHFQLDFCLISRNEWKTSRLPNLG